MLAGLGGFSKDLAWTNNVCGSFHGVWVLWSDNECNSGSHFDQLVTISFRPRDSNSTRAFKSFVAGVALK